MGPLRLLMIALALAAGGPAGAAPVGRWSGHIAEASRSFGIPESWIRRVMQAESGGRTLLGGRPIVSRAGAMGLMQLMPATWREMRALLGLGADPHDPRDNILAGAAYLRMMYDRFGHPGLFAAYNAGPGRYAEHLRSGRRLPGETVAYVSAVTGRAVPPPAPPSPGAAAALFAMRASPEPATSLQTGRPVSISNPLFVPLSSAGSR